MTRQIYSFLLTILLCAPIAATPLLTFAQTSPEERSTTEVDPSTPTSSPTTNQVEKRDTIKAVRDAVKAHRDDARVAREEYVTTINHPSRYTTEKKLDVARRFGSRQLELRTKALSKLRENLSTRRCAEASLEAKNAAAAAITKAEEVVQSYVPKIEGTATVQELRAHNKAMIEQTRVFIHIIPAINGMCLSSRMSQMIDSRLLTAIAKLEELSQSSASPEEKLTTARAAVDRAYELYKSVAENPSANEGRETLKSANDQMKQARDSLSQVKDELDKLRRSPTEPAPQVNETN